MKPAGTEVSSNSGIPAKNSAHDVFSLELALVMLLYGNTMTAKKVCEKKCAFSRGIEY
jgi:hypothetical protein